MHTEAPDSGGFANCHLLLGIPASEIPSIAASFFASTAPSDYTQVFIAADDGGYVVESYNQEGRRIQFCGLGALAAAKVVFDQPEMQVAKLEFANQEQTWQARSCADDSDIMLIYKKPVPQDCVVPAFAAAVLGVQPQDAAEVGGTSGYLVLELQAASMVRGLQPDFSSLTAATRRALIVTAKVMHSDGPGCVFRYFAPQYGPPEDAATGSAAVQLAAYWSSRLHCKRFTAEQLSLQSARLQLGCDGGLVDLTARVEYR